MSPKRKIGFLTKYLSNRHYISEVPVEGKRSSKFHFTTGYFDRYVNQINCLEFEPGTNNSNFISVTGDSEDGETFEEEYQSSLNPDAKSMLL